MDLNRLHSVLSRGYFPKELPRSFTTKSFANLLVDSLDSLPGHFGKPVVKSSKIPLAQEGIYSLARGGFLRRKLSICNPVLFFLIAREIIENWAEIEPHVSGSKIAATKPVFFETGRAINGAQSQSSRSKLAQKNRIGSKYILKTDISRFYHSIYTHSIPWALHGKKVAKSNRRLDILGNKLDFLVRSGRDGQTVGIPIGPDTSLVIAELLMQRCDEALVSQLTPFKGHRFIDDYELSFKNRDEAERAYHVLESSLTEFELALNPKKTIVQELPSSLEDDWLSELKRFQFRQSTLGQAADLEAFFSLAFTFHNSSDSNSVMQWAISYLRPINVDVKNWPLFQRLIMLCISPEPACLPYALEQIVMRKNEYGSILSGELTDLLNTTIIEHSELNHSSEVANALWGCLALSLELKAEAIDKLANCKDSCVALLALDCEKRGLTETKLKTDLWESYLNKEALYGENWLLAYEANVRGWLYPDKNKNYIEQDANFNFLKQHNVTFYRSSTDWSDRELPTTPTLLTYDELAT